MPSLLMKDGHLVMRSGALVTTENSASCDCCLECANGCCSENIPRFATVTITDVVDDPALPALGCDDCEAWNASWELELVSVAGYCRWRLMDGGCGPDPCMELSYSLTPCDNNVRTWTLTIYQNCDTPSDGGATYTHHSTEDLSDCEEYWAAMTDFLMQRSTSGGPCDWGALDPSPYNVSITLHD